MLAVRVFTGSNRLVSVSLSKVPKCGALVALKLCDSMGALQRCSLLSVFLAVVYAQGRRELAHEAQTDFLLMPNGTNGCSLHAYCAIRSFTCCFVSRQLSMLQPLHTRFRQVYSDAQCVSSRMTGPSLYQLYELAHPSRLQLKRSSSRRFRWRNSAAGAARLLLRRCICIV